MQRAVYRLHLMTTALHLARPLPRFDAPDLLARLQDASDAELHELDFGVVGMAHDGRVERYNRCEAELSGLEPCRVVGKPFFTTIAPCTNNRMVGLRLLSEPELDVTMDYTFALRLRPRQVMLRLLRSAAVARMYLVVLPCPES